MFNNFCGRYNVEEMNYIDPIQMAIQAFIRMYGPQKAIIKFDPELGINNEDPFFETILVDGDEKYYLVLISPYLPVYDSIEIILRELAIIHAGEDASDTLIETMCESIQIYF